MYRASAPSSPNRNGLGKQIDFGGLALPTTFNVVSLGNLADIDTVEGDNTAENASALVGLTFGGVGNALVDNFVSFSAGTGGFGGGSSTHYDQDNSPAENFSIDGGPDQVFDSVARYIATITYTDGTTAGANVAIFQDTAGNTYLAPDLSQSAAQDALEAGPIRSLTLDSLQFNTAQGFVSDRDAFEFAVCYAPGTRILTPNGEVLVEELREGDFVLTVDRGPQIIRWTHRNTCSLDEARTDAKPVQIKAGALGRNRPSQDLVVSPQHRILVGGEGQMHGVFASQAFAPAKSLTTVPGIGHMKGRTEIEWIHFACDRHEVVTANGCLSESLLLGPMVVYGLSAKEQRRLIALFGHAVTPDATLNGVPARKCLTVGAVKRQLAMQMKEKGELAAKEIKKWDCDLAMEQYEAERLREVRRLA
ncbi:MAG: Hint domain-containing protein [Roseobacter sp.]